MKKWLALVKQAVSAWIDDAAPSKGAALSYYTIFSIAPLLFIGISVAGLLFGTDAVQGAVLAQLTDLMGDGAAQAIKEMLANLQRPERGLWGAAVGIGLLLVGASTVFPFALSKAALPVITTSAFWYVCEKIVLKPLLMVSVRT